MTAFNSPFEAFMYWENETLNRVLLKQSVTGKRNSIEKTHQPFYKSWFDMNDKVIFE